MTISSEVLSLLILAVCIFLFVTKFVPNAVAAVIGCLLFSLTGICSLTEAFSGFSNSIVLLMFGMMVVGIAMMDTGATVIIGKYVAKWSHSSERLFILFAGIVSAALSTFLSNTAVIAIFLPLIESISKQNPKMNRRVMTLPVTMGAMFGGVCTLVGSTPQLTANGILEEMAGVSASMFDYFLPGLALTAVYLLYAETVGFWLSKKLWADEEPREYRESEDTGKIDASSKDSVSKVKLIMVLLIFLFTVVFFIGAWIPTATTAVIAAVLCMVTRCTNYKSVVKHMDWSVVFVLAGCLGIASGITKGGAGELMGSFLSGLFGTQTAPLLIFAVFVLLTMVVSNFITNSTAVVIMLPIALSLCAANGMNPMAFGLGIVYAANLTFSTPLANAQTAMTLVAGYKFSDYIRYTWLLDILVFAVIVAVVPLCFPLI